MTSSHSVIVLLQAPFGHLTGYSSGQEVWVGHSSIPEAHDPSQQWVCPCLQVETRHWARELAQERSGHFTDPTGQVTKVGHNPLLATHSPPGHLTNPLLQPFSPFSTGLAMVFDLVAVVVPLAPLSGAAATTTGFLLSTAAAKRRQLDVPLQDSLQTPSGHNAKLFGQVTATGQSSLLGLQERSGHLYIPSHLAGMAHPSSVGAHDLSGQMTDFSTGQEILVGQFSGLDWQVWSSHLFHFSGGH